ncbi:MAG TPA: hypothetical protein VJ302_36890 [Blastocatellia bacterium]|nr:hypothetical protein [Blastocatellia bacterium]
MKVEVGEETVEDRRVITITVSGEAADFLFADQLARRKVIEPITAMLKQSAQEATAGYLQSAEDVVLGVKPAVKRELPGGTKDAGKPGRKKRTEATEKTTEVESVTPKTIGGGITSTGYSGS